MTVIRARWTSVTSRSDAFMKQRRMAPPAMTAIRAPRMTPAAPVFALAPPSMAARFRELGMTGVRRVTGVRGDESSPDVIHRRDL